MTRAEAQQHRIIAALHPSEQRIIAAAPDEQAKVALANFLEKRHIRAFSPADVPSRAELESMDENPRSLYFIRCADGPIKIGIAVDVADRLSTLQIGCPYELTMLGYIAGGPRAERALHRAFAPLHVRGEWFTAPPAARKAIRGLLGIDDQGRKTR